MPKDNDEKPNTKGKQPASVPCPLRASDRLRHEQPQFGLLPPPTRTSATKPTQDQPNAGASTTASHNENTPLNAQPSQTDNVPPLNAQPPQTDNATPLNAQQPQPANNNMADAADEVDVFVDVVEEVAVRNVTTEPKPKSEYLKPPQFFGRKEEDAHEWMKKFERAMRFNRWTPSATLASFAVAIDGTALRWYDNLPEASKPKTWDDIKPEGDVPGAPGMRSIFLLEFQETNYEAFLHRKLVQRQQGATESVAEFYYQIIDWCNKIDPTMQDKIKLNFLLDGIRPELLDRMYPDKPTTCAAFLTMARKLEEGNARVAHRKGLAVRNLNTAEPAETAPVVAAAFTRGNRSTNSQAQPATTTPAPTPATTPPSDM